MSKVQDKIDKIYKINKSNLLTQQRIDAKIELTGMILQTYRAIWSVCIPKDEREIIKAALNPDMLEIMKDEEEIIFQKR